VNFLNVGPWELTVILIIAILLLGPKRVLEVVQSIRGLAGKLRDMSDEFSSLLQSEVTATEQEDNQASEDRSEPGGGKQEGAEDWREVVREGLTPIVEIQAELQSTMQETRQTLEGIVEDELVGPVAGVQAELQNAARETRRTVEDSVKEGVKPIANIQAELQATAQETSRAVKDVGGSQSGPKEQDEAPG